MNQLLLSSTESAGLSGWLLIPPAITLVAVVALAGALVRAGPRARRGRGPGPAHEAWTVMPGEHLAGDGAPAGSFLLLSGGPARLLLGDALLTVEEGGVLRLTGAQRAQLLGPVDASATLWLASEAAGGHERRLGRGLRRPSA
jgi:hypothetical protein